MIARGAGQPDQGYCKAALVIAADVAVGGFETTDHSDDFFDQAVGNVPFGEYKVHDKQYNKQNFLIHDYFLKKMLDKVRPGGVVAFIATKETLDKANSYIASQCYWNFVFFVFRFCFPS